MGHQFSLVLSREINDEESATLQEASCGSATFATGTLPTNPDVIVTIMDFDDSSSPSLAEAIKSALEAVKKVPDLSIPGLNVPAQPTESEQPVSEETEAIAAEVPAVRKPAAELAAAEDSVNSKTVEPTAEQEPTITAAAPD